MAERVTDLRDIRDRVIAELSGLPEPGVPLPDVPSILCAEDLAPADTAGLDPKLVVALATTLGGPTSHTAIIARQLGIPCVVAVDGLDAVAAGTMVLVDGTLGTVTVSPDPLPQARRSPRRNATPNAQRTGPAPARPPTGTPCRSSPTSRTVPRRAPLAKPPQRASACSAPNCASSTATPSPPSRSRPTSTPKCSRRFRAQGGDQDAGRRVGQAAEIRRTSRRGQPRARRARHPHRRRAIPGYLTGSCRPSPPPRSARAHRRG